MAVLKRGITVEELIAFNDELRALTRAGVPLEQGLTALGPDLPRSLRRLAEIISSRTEQGESLTQILHDPELSLPPVYCAVVAAGVRAGRLPAALESLSQSLLRAVELRRTIVLSLIYPLLLLLLASIIFVFTWSHLYPLLQRWIVALVERSLPGWFHVFDWSAVHGEKVLVGFWVVLLTGCVWWFLRSGRAISWQAGRRRWPSLAAVNAAGRVATFSETLALLVEQQIPLVEALELAGSASGDARVRAAAGRLAERLQSGESKTQDITGLPPLLSWLILTHAPSMQLVRALRQTATAQRQYAARATLFLGLYLPILCSSLVGVFVAVYYAALVMLPFFYLLHQLGQP